MNPPPITSLPFIKVQDLPNEERKFFIKVIRELLKSNNCYSLFHKGGMGLDESEEATIELINKGYLKIFMNKKDDSLHMEIWDGEKYIGGEIENELD